MTSFLHTNPRIAFETAIERGALSADETAENYAGRFMYMGDNEKGEHLFKHINTRAYIKPVPRAARAPKGWDVAETSVGG